MVGLVLAVVGQETVSDDQPATPRPLPYRAFSADSYWNTSLPKDAPRDPKSDQYIEYMEVTSAHPFLTLSGLGSDKPAWGNPIYWADSRSPTYAVVNNCRQHQPEVFGELRIPTGAQPSPDSDQEMTVYDVERDLVVSLWRASFDGATNTWSACGGGRYRLSSNGLHGQWPQSDDRLNTGHRGVPAALRAIRHDEVETGIIRHVLTFSTKNPSVDFMFPMVGSDGKSVDPAAPPQGARIRIKPSVHLSQYGLSYGGLVVARALQDYGAVLTDSSGAPTAMKVENCLVATGVDCWSGLLSPYELRTIPLDAYEFVTVGPEDGAAPFADFPGPVGGQ